MDFEEFADLAVPPGAAVSVLRSDLMGITFGERLAGQVNTPVDGFDRISGMPAFPLTMEVDDVTPETGVNVVAFRGTAIDGLGTVGFPDFDALGEGSLTLLFDRDQRVVSFDVFGSNGGSAYIQFFARDGSAVGAMRLLNLKDTTHLVSSAETNIAAMTITNDDYGGFGFDDFRFVPADPMPDDPSCVAGGPYEVPAGGDQTEVQLAADVSQLPTSGGWSYRWITDCPGGTFINGHTLSPRLLIDTAGGCGLACNVTLLLLNADEVDACATDVVVFGESSGPGGIECPESVVVQSDGKGNVDELYDWLDAATADGGVIVHDYAGLSDGCGATGGAVVNWSLEGASSQCSDGPVACAASFTIVDETAPVILLDADEIVVEDVDCLGSVFVDAPIATAVDDGAEVAVSSDAVESYPVGDHTITYSAVDACGNEGTATATVRVLGGTGVALEVLSKGSGGSGGAWMPAVGASAMLYEWTKGSCFDSALPPGLSATSDELLAAVAACPPDRTFVTDESGTAHLDVNPGHYVTVVVLDDDGDGVPDRADIAVTGQLNCGDAKTRQIKVGAEKSGSGKK